jgi:hypothetical protein
MEPHHILKVKNAVVKSVYYFMEYIICKLFVGRGEAYFYLEDEAPSVFRTLVSTYQYTGFHMITLLINIRMFMIAGTLFSYAKSIICCTQIKDKDGNKIQSLEETKEF